MDFIDDANECNEQLMSITIAETRRGLEGIGAEECEDCGEPIPDARRRACPSCTRCVRCQAEFERMAS